ncbi:PREDICTED: transcription factor grauzone [Drosophila arizonae]|uniref:Transcription factor grauzone n=1 Tax=Drosophila arizonae TaxID=7263 RepID=A0ABM1PFA5_DROAR|nr:PREDICTED: transcription factor grauzone [Drosophila arizonae]
MICRLCLNSANDTIQIFEGVGLSLNVATVLAKYFWFEPKCDDPISTDICVGCWTRVSDFNEFYASVEKAHRLLTERFSVKVGEQPEREERLNPRGNNGKQKQEEQEKQEDSKDFLLHSECAAEADAEEDLANDEQMPAVEALYASGNESDAAASFSNEQFLNDVLAQQGEPAANAAANADAVAEAGAAVVPNTEIVPQERRETRSTRSKSKAQQMTEAATAAAAVTAAATAAAATAAEQSTPAKRRGRSKAEKVSPNAAEELPKNKRYVDYKKSMLEIDEKIAQHMRLTCSICHEGQETFLTLCKHMMMVHHRKGYAVCCNKKFYKRSFLTDHIDRHSNPEKFKCQLCDRTFADKQCLRNHELLKHQPDEQKKFMCEHCPKRYTKQYLLDQHRIIHKERNVPCDICERRFPNMSMLCTHVKMVHGNYGIMCDICAQVIRGRAAFQRHQLEHAGITEPKVQCDICGSWHKNKYSLKKHVRRHNGSSEECTCNICGKVSPNRSAMLSHQRYVHNADRVHGCSVCKKKFKKAINLKEHMATHTGEVLYKCPHCPKTFNSNANKHSHRKKSHPKEFEEARKARIQNRMGDNSKSQTTSMITITTDASDGQLETHNILVTTSSSQHADEDEEDYKGEDIEYMLTLSPQPAE